MDAQNTAVTDVDPRTVVVESNAPTAQSSAFGRFMAGRVFQDRCDAHMTIVTQRELETLLAGACEVGMRAERARRTR